MKYNTYNLPWLLNLVAQGNKPDYLFFWGHQPSADGSVTASCFSQWWPSTFVVDGVHYATAEHWMMAKKAELFADQEALAKILKASTPQEAKQLGRTVRNFDEKEWKAHCFNLVCEGNLHKFGQHTDQKAYLIATGNRVIVEASPRDRIWGIGMGKENEHASNPSLWRGSNLLGFALMEVREKVKNEE